MVLAINIGNSNTTVGLFSPDGILQFGATIAIEKTYTRDQCAIALTGIFNLYHAEFTAITGVMIASVVPPLTAAISDAIKMLTEQAPFVVGPGMKTGLNIKAEIHNQLGADIVASSVGAMHRYEGPIFMINMGTATTISVLQNAVYEGCMIIPGIRIAAAALSQQAAELPHVSLEEAPTTLMGRNTIDSMRAGIIYGHAAMLDDLIARLEQEYAPAATVVATGGNAPLILRHCRRHIIYNPNLVMDGLYQLYQKTISRRRK